MKQLVILLMGLAVLLAACGNQNTAMDMSGMQMFGNMKAMPTHAHSDDAIAHFSVAMDRYMPGEEATITILIQDKWNKPIDRFDLMHEKLMHLIVVSKDLSYFDHLHPEHVGQGQFTVKTKFPASGYYQLIADFTPQGRGETVQTHWVTIKGKEPKMAVLQPDTSLTKEVDGKEVTLAFDHLMAGMGLDMIFTIKDARTKQPITDLQPYLGSLGHVVAISADAKEYVHVHPNEQKGSGPTAAFTIIFPKSGVYKIWGQFQHQNEVFIVPFTIKVP
ncbi:hypothetical protein P5G65_18345 [Paenibacillus chondroitinus]|uniref:YtkA-like domain-containing protein n=1 Tax=Paenibacillus chondroitinus TaxID=59842 RepID=A0ABU6DDN9_9BACL|nr:MULTISPECIES: hypothetical protein [Paenibacillus]MCY9663018.1 hypothetical protein [Paenibacillus anseongense]MEB4795863.1 hypothetical protein [Paenibacillus chondroitinus]